MECVTSLEKYTILLHNPCGKNVEIKGVQIVKLDDVEMSEQMALFFTINACPHKYVLMTTKPVALYKRFYSLILLNIQIFEEFVVDLSRCTKVERFPLLSEIKTYIYDLVVTLRYCRFIHRGVPTYILRMLNDYVYWLAHTEGIDYVTPAMVQRAFRDILPFQLDRLIIDKPSQDLSTMYGSNLELVKELMSVINKEDIVEMIINKVDTPI